MSSAAAGSCGVPGLDAESRSWIARLTGDGPERDRALADLHAYLLRAARFAAARRSLLWQLGAAGVDEVALEAAGEAMVALLAQLDRFRGQSRFTTWATKFAILQVAVAARRRAWLGRELPREADAWEGVADELGPETALELAELLAAVRRGIEEALTAHQRRVFVALALNHVPVDVLADSLGTTRAGGSARTSRKPARCRTAGASGSSRTRRGRASRPRSGRGGGSGCSGRPRRRASCSGRRGRSRASSA